MNPAANSLKKNASEGATPREGKPVVAIIGRQNVGKSTLLNRIVGKQVAIVEDLPGTTRDRIFADTSWEGVDFTLVDTGGLVLRSESTLTKGVEAQAEAAMEDADVIIFLTDVRDGVLPIDLDIAQMLRRTGKPVILAVNKIDSAKMEAGLADFYRLGFDEPMPVSAYHGRGVAEMLDKIIRLLPPTLPLEARPELMKIAITGRPGVGKSMLLNSLVGEQRVLVGETPGTTRDAIDTLLDFNGQNVLIIDTAGIRRRGRVEQGIEWYSVIRALRSIDRADVVLMVLDASELVTSQDAHVAGYIQKAAKGVIILVNKWDLVKEKNSSEYSEYIYNELKFFPYAPILFISAKLGQGVKKIMPLAYQIYQERMKRIAEDEVNGLVQQAVASHNIPRSGSKQLIIYHASQTGINPPTFTFTVNEPKLVHFSYQRYLENQLRQAFGFIGTPIQLFFKTRR